MRDVAGEQVHAGDVCVQHLAGRAARLQPVDMFEIAKPHFGSLPSVPCALNADKCFLI
jgi:hypothetical protein